MLGKLIGKLFGRYGSVLVFVTIVLSSAVASVGSYKAAEGSIVAEMNSALGKAMADMKCMSMVKDTVMAVRRLPGAGLGGLEVNVPDPVFRSYIASSDVRDTAYLRLSLQASEASVAAVAGDSRPYLCSDTVVLATSVPGMRVSLRGCAGCSRADVLLMSDQRPSLVLLSAALLWAFYCAVRRRRKEFTEPLAVTVGDLTLSPCDNIFFDRGGNPLRLTPMQHRLLLMFFNAEGHRLSHREICDELWPKKPDSSDTLYTLIRRLRCVVERHSRLRIETDRGQAYRLTDRR